MGCCTSSSAATEDDTRAPTGHVSAQRPSVSEKSPEKPVEGNGHVARVSDHDGGSWDDLRIHSEEEVYFDANDHFDVGSPYRGSPGGGVNNSPLTGAVVAGRTGSATSSTTRAKSFATPPSVRQAELNRDSLSFSSGLQKTPDRVVGGAAHADGAHAHQHGGTLSPTCFPVFNSPIVDSKLEITKEIDHLKDVIVKGLGLQDHKPTQRPIHWRPVVHAVTASHRLLNIEGSGKEPTIIDGKHLAGATLPHASPDDDKAIESWSEVSGSSFHIRGTGYMKDRVKVLSEDSLYKLVAVDIFSSESKIEHVAEGIYLPEYQHEMGDDAPELDLPPVLIFNLQIPLYPATLWAAGDGVGCSIVYYYTLPTDYMPGKDTCPGVELLRRFCGDGTERDGNKTRDRLKLIPRVVNLEEWGNLAPLSGVERSACYKYNEKPVLTRPQQRFYEGEGYMEVDLDVHQYAYMARMAIGTYRQRLDSCVLAHAFVLQGNRVEELPEQVLGCAVLHRVDWEADRPAPACVKRLEKGEREKRK